MCSGFYVKDDLMHSHSGFRMGVALVKSGRPAEAVPWLTNAVRLAEKFSRLQPGEKGLLSHLNNCLHMLARACREAGDPASADAAAARAGEVTRQLQAPASADGK